MQQKRDDADFFFLREFGKRERKRTDTYRNKPSEKPFAVSFCRFRTLCFAHEIKRSCVLCCV